MSAGILPAVSAAGAKTRKRRLSTLSDGASLPSVPAYASAGWCARAAGLMGRVQGVRKSVASASRLRVSPLRTLPPALFHLENSSAAPL